MKIGYFYRHLSQGGVQRMIANAANYFARNGHDVSVVLKNAGGEYHGLLDERVKVIYFASIPGSRPLRLWKVMKRENFDVLFTATPNFNIYAVLTRILSRSTTKIVISERNNTLAFYRGMKWTRGRLVFLAIPVLYRFADAIVAVSQGVGDGLRRVALVRPERIRVIHNPAHPPDLEEQLKLPLEHEWFDGSGIPVIVTAGRLAPIKNHRMLIDAMAILTRQRPARLIILGEGPARAELAAQISSLGLEDSVRLAGFQLDPVAWISRADLFVLSSNFEGFGNVLVEALAAGATIVSTDCDFGPAEILGQRWGYLSPVGDAAAFADRMAYALDNPIPSAVLKERAADFGVDQIMATYSELFQGLASERAARLAR